MGTCRALLMRVLWCMCLVASAHAQAPEAVRLLDEGNRLYAEGAFGEALEAYEAALGQGIVSGALFHNMGNAYYRLDKFGQALRHYEKAHRILGDDPQLLHNLQTVGARIGTPFSALPGPFWEAPWKKYAVRQGPMLFFGLGGLLYVIAAILFGHRIWTGIRAAWHRRALAVSSGLGVLLIVVAFGVSLDAAGDYRAVVIAREAPLMGSPGAEAEAEVTVPEGVIVDVLSTQGDWAEVRLPNGVTGFLPRPAVGKI